MRGLFLGALALGVLGGGSVHAETDLFSLNTISGSIDLRLAAADGEESWLEGGFGKLRYGGDGEDVMGHADLAEAHLIWQPVLPGGWRAEVSALHQPDQDHAIDLNEAFVGYSWGGAGGHQSAYGSAYDSGYGSSYGSSSGGYGPASGGFGFDVRAGLFYPPVSMEHTGAGWTTPDYLTPSAINSWIGEEVKVVALEAGVRGQLLGEVAATAAVFTHNDTAGTLLTARGWALHDMKATAWGDFALPPTTNFLRRYQGPHTEPVKELDHREGYYVRLDWKPAAAVALNAFYYDNQGDRDTEEEMQWAWETRFANLGASWQIDERTRVQLQAMDGVSVAGRPNLLWGDIGFRSAYLLASRRFGRHTLTGRLDSFSVRDESFEVQDSNSETGWAAMAAWRHGLGENIDLLAEITHVSSERPGRLLAADDAEHEQTLVQTALRVRF